MSEYHRSPEDPQPYNPNNDPGFRPQPRLPDPGQPERTPEESHKVRTALIVIGSLIVGLIMLSSLIPSGDPKATPPAAVSSVDNGPTPDPITTPTNKPSPSVKASTPTAPKTTAKPAATVYKKLTARAWAKIAKSPDTHAGEAYTVYGRVSQFDSATGDDQFRADVDGVKHSVSYGYVDYPTNTLMTNISGDVSDLVEDDLFTAKVIVIGAFSYDTQIGGETTVPQLSVMSIKVTGSVK